MLICNREPDLIIITEAIPKAQRLPISPAQLFIAGYTLYTNFSPSSPNLGSSGTRGICVYAAESLGVSEVALELSSIEQVWIRLALAGSDSLLIGCLYRSPSGNTEESIHHLEQLMLKATAMPFSHLMIIGDFNIPQINWDTVSSAAPPSHGSHSFIETIQDCLLYQHVQCPTRYRLGETPSVLDLVFTNEEGMVRNLEYLPGLGNSDHLVLWFTLVCYSSRSSGHPTHRVHTDYELLTEELKKHDWEKIKTMELEEAYGSFKKQVAEAVERCSKRKRMSSKKNIYMNRTAMQLRKKKETLWRKYTLTRDLLDHARFTRCRNQLRKLTRDLRKKYEMKLAVGIKQNPKSFWRYTSSRLKTKSRVEALRNEEGGLTVDSQEKSEVLSRYFSSVYTIEDDEVPPSSENTFRGPALEDIDVSPEKVRAKLASLRPTSSPGPDTIHPRMLRESASVLSAPLSVLFRKSVDSGRLPADWKTGDVTPVYKKGDRQNPASYRPISLTSIPSKVLESIIRDNLLQHMSGAGLLHGAQHGFLPKRSCISQLMEVMEDWSAAIEAGEPVDVIYLDFAKAFDSVPHQRLLNKLHGYGIRGRVLDWIAAFLLDRRQRVVVQGSKSDWAPVTSGIPQGSVLGPTLFSIFVNDMPEQVSSCIKLFADDTKLYRQVSGLSGATGLQADIDALVNWSRKWLLPFNASKCRVMHIGRQNPGLRYHLGDTALEETVEEKDLGIVVDDHLKFHQQTAAAAAKASQMLAVVKRSFANLDETTLPLLYKSMVRPFLEYGNAIWGPFGKLDQKRLERIQRRATRMVKNLRHLPYPERLRRLGLPSLYYRRRRGDMITVFQLLHGGIALTPETFLTRHTSDKTRGHPWKLQKPRAKALTRRNAFSTRVINDWNSLPAQVVSASSINQFKARLDKHWASLMHDTPSP